MYYYYYYIYVLLFEFATIYGWSGPYNKEFTCLCLICDFIRIFMHGKI